MRKESNDKPETREEVLERAFNDMCKSLDKFGPGETLDLLIAHSRLDPVVFYLLTRFPAVLAIGDLLSNLRVVKVDKGTYKRLKKRGWIL